MNERRSSICVSSSPPPLPKIPPTSEAVAMMSVTFHGSSGLPIAAYSPGIFVMSSRASSMYLLTPATYSAASAWIWRPSSP